jgi:hypothetical protein
MIFSGHGDAKWIRDENSGVLRLHDTSMDILKIFNELKAIINRCVTMDGEIDAEMLGSLIHSVSMRIQMMQIADKYSDDTV